MAAATLAGAEARLHAARPEDIEAELVAIALAATGHGHGALFIWDRKARGLALAHHVANGVTLTLPQVVTRNHDRAGIAMHAFDEDEPYLCADTAADPKYTRYLVDVGSIAAVPINYQNKPIGVLTVSDRDVGGMTARDLALLEELARLAAPLLRRVQLDRQSREETGRPFLIKGLSLAWLEVERKIELAAPTRAPILVRGESGTGKDLVSRAIHANSQRADKPFVAVNCAAIPETLLESILFGHVKGAFTGASFHKVGEFQKADGGTLFLDEIGELPVMLQAKVLRAVEQGEVQPLGSNEPPSRVDVRLIGATNRDLEAMAKTGQFRDDLFYRLSVMTVELPPLRSYKDNLEVLANVFVEQAARAHGKRAPRLGPAVLARLDAYDFPGNVRELKNAMEHAVILCAGDELSERDLPKPLLANAALPLVPRPARRSARPTLKELREVWLAPLEKRYLGELLAEHGGSVRKAAAAAGIDAVTLYRLLRKRGVAITRHVTTD
jgi:DNA-binding NtrC family response regulator